MVLATRKRRFPPQSYSGVVVSMEREVAAGAQTRLRQSSYCELRRVRCDFHEGVLTLRGRLPSYYLKQIAQTVVREIDEVDIVVNQVEVTGLAGRLEENP